jgi:ABC-type multidrug transport system ATPase subunit
MIELRSVDKAYGARRNPVRALIDATLSLGPGVWAVVGPNGAGKTTLLGLILGFLRPSGGTIRIDGVRPDRYVRRRGAAYLPERFRVPGAWTVRSALRSLAALDGTSHPEGRTARVLDRLGLADQAGRTVAALSRGMSQRLGLAQALLAERELIVLDEPTEGLDPLWRVRFREIVQELRTGGRTILLASHELGEVERIADHAILLENGRVREIIEIGSEPTGPVRYRITGTLSEEALHAFPGAERPEAGTAIVTVADARELSNRLAALLDRGAVVTAVTPLDAGLEERVRKRLEER